MSSGTDTFALEEATRARREVEGLRAALERSKIAHAAVIAICASTDVRQVDRLVVDRISDVTGFRRGALLRPPTADTPAGVRMTSGDPPVAFTTVPRRSILAAGAPPLTRVLGGSGEDLQAPHFDVRGTYAIAPLGYKGELAAYVYGDELEEGIDPADAVRALGELAEVASVARASAMLLDERDRMRREAEALARTDALTGLPNRRVFQERVLEEIARANRLKTPFCVAIVDVDNFKHINDTRGHAGGDLALKTIAETLRIGARDVDVVARYAGDEFGIVTVAAHEATAAMVAERTLVKMRQTGMTTSIGIAEYADGMTADDLIARADEALYHSKENGRDRVTVHSLLS